MPHQPRGRPTKRSLTVERNVIRLLKIGNTRTAAAKASGISYDTLARWARLSAEFCNKLDQAEAEAETLYVNDIANMAREGNFAAAKFWLVTRRDSEWREPPSRQQIGGDPENPAPLIVERVRYDRDGD